jgi:hypothetical protein
VRGVGATQIVVAVIHVLAVVTSCRSPAGPSERSRDQKVPAPGAAKAKVVATGGGIQSGHGPTTEPVIIARLTDAVTPMGPGGALQRIAIADVAYPRTETENVAMGGYALLLVTSVVHEAGELPLARVRVKDAAGELELQRAALRRSELADARLSAALGTHRTDELYYLPVLLTRVPSVLVVDFAKNRAGLEVMRFPPPASEDAFPAGVSVIADIATPNVRTATALAREEFGWSLE